MVQGDGQVRGAHLDVLAVALAAHACLSDETFARQGGVVVEREADACVTGCEHVVEDTGDNDLGLVHDGEPVGQRVSLLQVVGGQHHGRAGVQQLADERPGVGAGLGIQPGGGLVTRHPAPTRS